MSPPVLSPPRSAEWIGRRAAGRALWEDGLAGDLHEEFASIVARRGLRAARWWYRRQVLDLAGDALAARLGSAARFGHRLLRPTGDPHMRSFFHEFKPAVRSLMRQPLPTVVIVVTLAIGLGSNAAVLGMVDALLLRPFPFDNVDSLVMFAENSPQDPYPQYEVAPANYVEWRDEATSFTAMAAFTEDTLNLSGSSQPERVSAAPVSGSFFELLGIVPTHGRLLSTVDDVSGSGQQAVISDALWKRRFGGEDAVLGRVIQLDGRPFTVVGITPEGFSFPAGSEVWIPLAFSDEERANRRDHYLTVIARLAPGVSFEQAASEMTSLYGAQREAHPEETRDRSLVTRTFVGGMVDIGLVPILGLWQAAALLVLIIGCANVANLLLARGTTRRRELAVRVAMGASRTRLVRQLLVESLLLSIIATPAALVVAAITFGLVRGAMPQQLVRFVAGWTEMGVDVRLAAVTLGAALVTSLVFGLLPALQASRPEVATTLKDGGRSMSGSRQWLRRGLVVAQLALALPLLIASGMSAIGAQRFAGGPQGYEPEGVMRLTLVLPQTTYADADSRRRFAERLLDDASVLPGVDIAATTTVAPSSASNQRRTLVIDGKPTDPERALPVVNYRAVSPGYFGVMRIPVLEGRNIESRDRPDSERVALVSQSMAERFWPGESPLGSRIHLGAGETEWRIVVGIVGDTIDDWFAWRNTPTVYLPAEQAPSTLVNLMLRARGQGDPEALAEPARQLVASLDPTLAPFEVTTMPEAIRIRTTGIRFVGGMMAAFGLTALGLAAIGIYSVMAYFVAQRRQEIGIRMALGASARDVLTSTAAGGARMTLVGIAIGLGLGVVLARLIESALFGTVAIEPWLFVAIAAALAGVALAASLIPARQAARVDPVVALRE